MFTERNRCIIVLVLLLLASRGNSVEIADGDLHVTRSTALFTATANVPSSPYTIQWRFNGIAACQVFILGGAVIEERCNLTTTIYSGHNTVSGVLSGSNLTTQLTYSKILHDESVVVVSLYDGITSMDIGTPVNLKVQNCTDSSEGYDSNFVDSAPSCDYNCTSNITCPESQEGDSFAVCESDASWKYTCTNTPTTTGTTTISTDEQPAGGNNTRATHRMSEGDIAGTVLTCIFILECICLCVFVFALNYDLSLKLIIGLYVAGICLSIIGIFMSFFGSSTAGTVMNSVEIAGTVLGSVGITVMLGGIVMQALKGVGSKDYAAGEPPK